MKVTVNRVPYEYEGETLTLDDVRTMASLPPDHVVFRSEGSSIQPFLPDMKLSPRPKGYTFVARPPSYGQVGNIAG